jgi:hypothetical protein
MTLGGARTLDLYQVVESPPANVRAGAGLMDDYGFIGSSEVRTATPTFIIAPTDVRIPETNPQVQETCDQKG